MITSSSSPALNKRAVIMSGDKNVVPFARFIAAQIALAEPERDFDICFCTPDTEIKFDHPAIPEVRLCIVNTNQLDLIPTKSAIPRPSHYKLALPNWFKDEYDYIVHLDTDVYLRKGCISDLFAAAEKGRAVSAIADTAAWQDRLETVSPWFLKSWIKMGIDDQKYLNAGVLVFDVKAYCDGNYLAKAIEFTRQHWTKYTSTDQDAFNGALRGNWAPLSLKWNWMTGEYTSPLIQEFEPYILHFTWKSKPYLTNANPWIKYYYDEYKNGYERIFDEPMPTYSYPPAQKKPVHIRAIAAINTVNPFFKLRMWITRIVMIKRFRHHIQKIEQAIIDGNKIWPPSMLDDPQIDEFRHSASRANDLT